jgi:photosynthetic reaction center cytochrome c subunit
MKVKNKFFVSLGVIAVCIGSATILDLARAQSPASAPATGAVAPKTAEQQFKNIQVLKGIPADQLIPAMQFISASLGVECEFCHVQGAFEKDDKKPKQTARKMMEMMITINQENFDGHREVTCYSCHRGSADPVGMPPVMTAEMGAASNEARSAQNQNGAGETKVVGGPTPDELLDKYLHAVGGSSAIEKISSRVMKGAITFGDRNVPIDIYSKEADKRISITHTPDGDSITAFDGQEGWLAAPKRPIREMHGGDIDGAAMDADLHFPAHLKGICSKTEVLGMEKIADHEAYLIRCDRENKTPLRLYFDAQSRLLVRLVRYAETPLGQLPTQIDYADYRQVDGVKIPLQWTLARPGGRFTIQISEVKQNVPVGDAKFAKPAAPPEEKGPKK